MDTIGVDLDKRESQLCIITSDGELIERRIVPSRARFAEGAALKAWTEGIDARRGKRIAMVALTSRRDHEKSVPAA